ncbi:uncharacterized protein QC761_0011070 [Podospora bellae-mahoneyi]|uniref:Uncharacterized protein n=1 Tax=Podospora bellae-mahoneyi TaxID=2093777 RepID=A0ABR0FYL9_9PEZI|nr:hypothetical protein QC761_0011070 [Podospora bellae-mahoneyi]
MPIMVSTVLYLACLSALQLPLSSAQKTTTSSTTVPILDWGFDFPGSAISVVGQTSGSTTYRLTCNSPGECQWTQVPDRASYLNNMVGTMTFIEAGAPYNAAVTLNISARGTAFSYQATCTPRTKPITIQTTDSEGRFTDFPVRAPNLVDCTSTSMGKEPTPTFELDGTTGVYKMVVITQGVEKLDFGAAPTGLITTGGLHESRDESSGSSSSSSFSSSTGATDAPAANTQTPDSAGGKLVTSSLRMAGFVVLMTALFA